MERRKVVDDFPLWLKIIVWLIVGGTVTWTITAHALLGFNRLIEEFF
jgi:hypothetical protein